MCLIDYLIVIPLQPIHHAVDRVIFLKHIPFSWIILNGFSVLSPVTYQAPSELPSMPHLLVFPLPQKPPKSSHPWPTTISNTRSLSHLTVAPSIWNQPSLTELFISEIPAWVHISWKHSLMFSHHLIYISLWHQEIHYYRYFYASLCICQSPQLYCK